MLGLISPSEEGLKKGELEDLVRRDPFGRYLPYLDYTEETGEYEIFDNTKGRLWECRPITFLSDPATVALSGLLRQEYPNETVFQFILYPDDHIDGMLERYKALKTRKDDWVQEGAARYAKHLSEGRHGVENLRGIPVRNFRLFVSVKAPVSLTNEQVAMIEENLATGGFAPQRVKPGKLLEWLRRLFNDHVPHNAQAYDSRCHIRSQVINAESPVEEIRGVGMKLGRRYAGCLSPKSMPDAVDGLPMNRIIGGFKGREDDTTQLLHRFLWCTSVLFRTTEAEIKRKATMTMAQKAGGSIAKTIGRRTGELNWVLDEVETEPYCNVISSMWVFGDSEDDLNKGMARARGLWEKNNFVMQRDDHIATGMLIASLPFGLYLGKNYGNIDVMMRDFAVSVTAAANLLPVQGDFAGNMNPVLLYVGRKGQLASIDVFDKGANNHNYLVCAGSGAGKSFQCNFLAGNYYAAGSLIRAVDIGYSYDKQCMAAKGRFIDIGDEAAKICINPFTAGGKDGDDVEGNEKMTANIVLTMIYSSTGTNQVTETQYSLVKDGVRFARERDGGERGVEHVQEFLRTYPKYAGDHAFEPAKAIAHEMAFNLRDFVGGGKYGSMFNGQSTLNIKDDEFVVLEMEQLLNDEELFRVVSMQVINAITQDLYLSDRSQQRFMLFDEAWKYLGASQAGASAPTVMIAGVISEGYRRARKYGGSTGIVTQSPLDLLNFGPAGNVIKSNSAFKFFLESEDYVNAVKAGVLDYSGLLLELACSVKNNKPKYSEVLFDTPFGAGVGRLCVDKWTYWNYTSAAPEVAQFKHLVHGGLTPKQALDTLAGVAQ